MRQSQGSHPAHWWFQQQPQPEINWNDNYPLASLDNVIIPDSSAIALSNTIIIVVNLQI